MPGGRRWHPNKNGRVTRDISIHLVVWEWLKQQPGGASGWIDYTAGRAMLERVNERLKEENLTLRSENARLVDIMNAQGIEPQRKK